MNSNNYEESISSTSSTGRSSVSSTPSTLGDSFGRGSVAKSERPQNFYKGRKLHGKRPCLWGCEKYLTESEMETHTEHNCHRRNEPEMFRAAFSEEGLVALRHPNGRPKLPSQEQLFQEKILKEKEREALRWKLRGPFLKAHYSRKGCEKERKQDFKEDGNEKQ